MVLLTGACGLLGIEVAGQLRAAGFAVRTTDRRVPAAGELSGELVLSDLLDRVSIVMLCAGVSTIIHTAAVQHHSHPPRWGRERFFQANVEMTHNLVDAAVAAGVGRFVYVSSDMVYGMPPGRALRETDVPRPIGPYGRSKLAAERICEAARERGLRVTILRPRLIVGPGRLGVLTKLFDRIRAGGTIPMLGNGRNRYQMVAVADVAAACIRAIDKPIDGTFNLGSHDPPPVRELLTELARRAGSPSRPRALPASLANAALWTLHAIRCAPLVPEQFRIASVDYVLDTSRARDELGWSQRYTDMDMLWEAYKTYCNASDSSGHFTPPDLSRKSAALSDSPRTS